MSDMKAVRGRVKADVKSNSSRFSVFTESGYPDEIFLMFFFASLSILDNRARHFSHQKKPRPLFPKGRGIRSCYHLMFPKRSHAPAHGVLIIKDPGISNGCQFRHSLLTFSGYLRSRFRCEAPGCIQKKKSARLSSTGSFLCGADPIPTCSLHCFSIIYRLL